MRTALLSTTAIVAVSAVAMMASSTGAYATDHIVNTAETSTIGLGAGFEDSLSITGSGEIHSVNTGVIVNALADFITIGSTGVSAEIDVEDIGIVVIGGTANLTGGISIASGAIVRAENLAGTQGTGIFVFSDADISGGITNAGIIEGQTNAISLAGSGSIAGGISNSVGGLIQGDAGDGISIAAWSVVGSNPGDGISNASSATIRGNINGIDISGYVLGGIANSGSIVGTTGDAILITSGVAYVFGGISNAVGASIVGGDKGINIEASAQLNGGISNSGLIEGTLGQGIVIDHSSVVANITNASGADIIGHNVAIDLADATLIGNIVNTGDILGDTTGIRLVTTTMMGTITNNSGGIIYGDDYGISVVGTSDVTRGIVNSGSIIAQSANGTGIHISGSSTVGSISNSGTITGGATGKAVQFGDSASTLTLQTGSHLNGDADGGGGVSITDTLVLEGMGDEDAVFTNFETLTVDASTLGTWVLSGDSNFDALTLNSGTLDIQGDFVATTATLAGGSLKISSTASLTVGTVAATASGDLDVSGTLTASGGVTVGGALNIPNAGSLNAASLDVGGDADFAGALILITNSIVIGGALNMTAGTLAGSSLAVTSDVDIAGLVGISGGVVIGGALNVASTGRLDGLAVSATDVDVEGQINSAGGVTISGILSGSGTITGGLVTVNGILSPGNSPGQINLPSINLANGTSYLVEHEVGASPETDITVLTGTATIGTDVDVNVSIGAGTDGFQDDIMTAAGGIIGSFSEAIGIDDNVVALVAYPNANTATLLVAKTDALAATVATVSDAGLVFLDNLQEGARRDGRVWATGYIYKAENEGLGQNGADFDQDGYGFNAGVDVISQPNLKVGLAVGYLDLDIGIDSSTSDAENDGIFGAAYLTYMNDNFYLEGAIMVGQQTVDTTRTLSHSTATASVDATSYGANLEAGFELEALGGRLSPFVKMGIHSVSLDSYSEAATADTGAITVGEVDTQQMRVGAGVRYAIDLGSEDGIQVTPTIKMGLTQEWHDGDSSAAIGFVGYTGSTTASLDFKDQTTIDLGLSFDVKLSQAVTAFIGWDAALGDETTRNTGTIGLSVNW